jgi:hypothetical protein
MDTNLTNLRDAADAVSPGTFVTTATAQTVAGAKSLQDVTLKKVSETVHSIGTTGGTVAPNVANGTVQTINLNSALTINGFTSPVAGQSVTLIVTTNGFTTCTSTMKFAGGTKTFSTQTDILNVLYDGTNYWAGIVKGFV